jgi:hypothetical protein
VKDKMTEDKARALAQNPQNKVYYYKSREPLEQVVPFKEVERLVYECWKRYRHMREKVLEQNETVSEQDFARMKKTLDEEFAQFSYTHPLIYDRIVRPETVQAHVDAIFWMINLKREDPSDKSRVLLARRIMAEFAVSPEEWEATHGKKTTDLTIEGGTVVPKK